MPIVVLLIIGLVCLAVGLLLSSTLWLVVSLLASVLAAGAIYRNRDQISAERPARTPRHGQPAEPEVAETSAPADEPAVAPSLASPADAPADVDVWVVDGRPRYHREGCEIIRDQPVEAIPHSQASEDGFIPCSLCEPDRSRSARSV